MHSDAALLSKPCIWREGLHILNEEGFRAFWKGNLVTVVHRLPYTALNFYAYDRYKKVSINIIFRSVVILYCVLLKYQLSLCHSNLYFAVVKIVYWLR